MRFRLGIIAALVCANLSFGQTFTWTNVGTDWGTNANWSPSGFPNDLVTQSAVFGPQAVPVQPNVAGIFSVNGISFDNTLAGWNLTGSAGNLLRIGSNGITWTGGGTSILSANLQIAANQIWDVGTTNVTVGGTPTVGALFGTGGLTKAGAGTLILDSGIGLFTGGFTINNGTLQAGSATNSAASQALRSSSVFLGGGTSLITVGATIDLRVGSLSGTGAVTPAVGGAINELALASATFSGPITTTGGLNLRGATGATQTFNGNLTALTGTIGINSGVTLVLSGTGDSTSGVLGGGMALRGGGLTLDNTGGNTSAANGRLSDATAVTLLGGMFSLIGNSAGTSESVGAVTFNSSAANVSVTSTSGGAATLTFGNTGTFSLRGQTSMTVNFVGVGGTLGGGGANPTVKFVGTPFTGTVTGLLSNTAGSDTTIGWATVNGSEWAGYSATNGIVAVAPTLTASTNTTLQTATATSITVFNPSANQTLTGAVSTGTLKLAPTAAGLQLDTGANNINTVAIMLAGNNDFTITGSTGAVFGTNSGTRYFHVVNADTTLNVSNSLTGAQQPFNKSGAGFLNLNGSANQVAFTSVQNINLLQGVTRVTTTSFGGGNTSAAGAFTTTNLYGGVLEISGGGSLIRAVNLAGAAGGGGLKWDGGGSTRGDGGFSAVNGNATVSLVTTVGGATPAVLQWNTGGFVSNGYALTMGSTKADSRIDLTNDLQLDTGAATNNYFGREVRVAKNVSSTTDVARLSGVITGSSNADLIKTGAGTLELTNNGNNYAGNTQVLQGTLRANNASGSATGTGNVLVKTGATIGGSGFIVPNNNGGNIINVSGTVAPGNSAGTLTMGSGSFAATVTLSGHYNFELSNAGTSAAADTGGSSLGGAVHDLVTVFGSMNVAGLIVDPTSLGASGFDNTQSYSWTIATATGGITGVPAAVSVGAGTEFAGMSFLANVVGNNLYLNFTPVPEPATVLAISAVAFGAGGLIRRRYRKELAA